jgi:hypothetical protein
MAAAAAAASAAATAALDGNSSRDTQQHCVVQKHQSAIFEERLLTARTAANITTEEPALRTQR